MNTENTFGRFLVSKRMEQELSARQLAIALDYSAVYICDIEKDRRPVPDGVLDKFQLFVLIVCNSKSSYQSIFLC